jgi:hypothetical protein
MLEYDARDVLDAYLAALSSLEGGATIRDAGELSYPKDIIKSILQHCLRTIEDASQRELLRHAYLSLASFQELSDEERKALVVLRDIGPLAPTGDERHKRQAARLSDVAAPLGAALAKLRADTLVLTHELTLLQGGDAQN